MDQKPDLKLKNKSALVLGGIKGIGKSIAEDLLNQGCSVAVTYFDWLEELDSLKESLNKTKGKYSLHYIDLRDTDKIPYLIEEVRSIHKNPDILINNIERGGMPVVHGKYNTSQWDLEQETTLRAKHFIFEAIQPHIKKSENGCIINFSSIASITGRTGPAGLIFNDGYCAASRAVSVFTETWARLMAPNVRVNEIMLGFMETRHASKTRGWGLLSQDQKEAIINHTLCAREGKISDIIKAVNFIIHDAPFMTGATLRLDGGYVLGAEKIPPMPEGVE
ncbi:MAG: SDR family oxidoreductase [Desulfobacteraceae bacterium]|nr:SDR family oxidoreductase [Desulfobacteraceae bacterium]MCB9494114.1 SDR family oxidoreductase [Desulfobacteraceae bacterium]